MPEKSEEALAEKRRFVRLNVSCDVNYKILNVKPPKSDKSQTKNISAGGICLIAEDELRPGTDLELDFDLLDKQASIKAKGRVVWSKPFKIAAEPQHFDCGVEFIKINPADQQRINQYAFSYK